MLTDMRPCDHCGAMLSAALADAVNGDGPETCPQE